MLKSISKGRAWIYLLVMLILFTLISYFSFSPEPMHYPNYVTDSPSPTGVKALYTYLGKEKKVKKWSHAPNLLNNGEKDQLLIMAEPYFFPKNEELQAYINFMEAGHTILLLKKNPKGMFDLTTAPISGESSSGDAAEVYSRDGNNYRAEISSTVRLQTNQQDEILLSDQAGTIAVKRPFGEGQLIVSIAPEWMANEKILDFDHTTLLSVLLTEEDAHTILFDEYIHGGENAAKLSVLYPKWFLLLMLQGILIAVLFLWHKGKRFGPIYSPREETVRFSDESLQALSAWYIRGRRYHDSLLIQADYVKLLMQERWGIPYGKRWMDLSDFLERKWINMPRNEIQTFLLGLSTILANEKVNKQEYLLWSRKLDRLKKEVEER
ncbi:DUF4350 domain-containing protein [Bacillus sp. JJ1773]|uniref:DUF4350 domain-containing protein n=1 Tax=Bacillus sp. JJ1773 TaxID=3122965 RepID=UPI003000A1AE